MLVAPSPLQTSLVSQEFDRSFTQSPVKGKQDSRTAEKPASPKATVDLADTVDRLAKPLEHPLKYNHFSYNVEMPLFVALC